MRVPSVAKFLSFFLILVISGCSTTPIHTAFIHDAQARTSPQRTSADPQSKPATAVVKSVKANVRAAPSRSSAVVTEVANGEVLTLITATPTGAVVQGADKPLRRLDSRQRYSSCNDLE